MNEEVKELIGRLKTWGSSCTTMFADLRTIDFVSTSEDSYIEFQDKTYCNKKLYFKSDPQDPKNAKVIHALKQFCKILGVPAKFFIDCRPQLRANMVKNWQMSLTENDKKAQVIIKLRESGECSLIRCFLPVKKSDIVFSEIIEHIVNSISVPISLEFVHGDGRDDLILHARFLFDNEYEISGKKICFGFTLMASELDAHPLVVDFFVHDKESKTSYMMTYGGDPCLVSNYEDLKIDEIREVIPSMLNRIEGDIPEIIARIEDRVQDSSNFDPKIETTNLCKFRGLSGKLKQSIYLQVAECIDEIKDPLDLARNVCLVAKDFDIQKRVLIERAAGVYLNLSFMK